MKNMLRAIVALVLLAASPLLTAAGWGSIMRDGPVQDFHDEDMRLYLDAIKRALEGPGSPQPVEWRNAESGAGGSLLVLGQPKVKGYDECRRVRTTLYSKKRKGDPSVWTACKDPGGRWVLVRAG